LDVSVKGENLMSLVFSSAEKNVAHDHHQSTSGDKNPKALLPALVEFVEKLLVVRYLP